MRTLNLTGMQFGKLTAIRWTGKADPKRYRIWEFRCACGAVVERSAGYVSNTTKRGWAMSCGSLECSGQAARRLPGNAAAINRLLGAYRKNASVRGLEFSLNKDEAMALFQGNCYYCGKAPSQIAKPANYSRAPNVFIYNGIDRVDNSKGYIQGNVVSCCGRCNKAKDTMSANEFISLAKTIASNF